MYNVGVSRGRSVDEKTEEKNSNPETQKFPPKKKYYVNLVDNFFFV